MSMIVFKGLEIQIYPLNGAVARVFLGFSHKRKP